MHAAAVRDRVLEIQQAVTLLGRGVHHREIQDIVRGVQFDEEVEHLVDYPLAASGRFVDLVDDHDDRQVVLQGLL